MAFTFYFIYLFSTVAFSLITMLSRLTYAVMKTSTFTVEHLNKYYKDIFFVFSKSLWRARSGEKRIAITVQSSLSTSLVMLVLRAFILIFSGSRVNEIQTISFLRPLQDGRRVTFFTRKREISNNRLKGLCPLFKYYL